MTRAVRATSTYHPSRVKGPTNPSSSKSRFEIPKDREMVQLEFGDRTVKLTNLQKPFWPKLGLKKRDLLQYYIDMSHVLLPHLQDRAMVMKRYPNGAGADFFFMKHAPTPRPDWIEICSIEHSSGNIIDFPVVRDLPTLLWTINLGCIDLNQWYARCDDVDRPDYVNFDLDPVPGAGFRKVRETALLVRDALARMKMPSYAKTTGATGMHVYVPIVRGPIQKQVWTFAKSVAQTLASERPGLITSEYQIARRPRGHVLVDYNQNAWGRTLASVYSLRPTPKATVSMPVTWEEVERGFEIADFRIDNVPERIQELGDLWKPLTQKRGRIKLEQHL